MQVLHGGWYNLGHWHGVKKWRRIWPFQSLHAERFTYCALQYNITCVYSTVCQSTASIYDLGSVFALIRCALVNVYSASSHIYHLWTSMPYCIYLVCRIHVRITLAVFYHSYFHRNGCDVDGCAWVSLFHKWLLLPVSLVWLASPFPHGRRVWFHLYTVFVQDLTFANHWLYQSDYRTCINCKHNVYALCCRLHRGSRTICAPAKLSKHYNSVVLSPCPNMLQRQISSKWYFPSLQSGLLHNIALTGVSKCIVFMHLLYPLYTIMLYKWSQTLLPWVEGLASQTTVLSQIYNTKRNIFKWN